MSKALESLENIGQTTLEEDLSVKDIYDDDYYNIKEALQRLEEIENTNPSDVFEYVENIQGEIEWAFEFNGRKIEEYEPRIFNIIKQYILKAQEQEKVLKIIKEKNVDVRYFRTCNVLEDYNYCQYFVDELSQEEFDSLKHYFITFKLF